MFASQASERTGYTATIAYLAVALIFIPAVLVASRPLAYSATSLAIGCSVACLALAWANWRKSASVARLSSAAQKETGK